MAPLPATETAAEGSQTPTPQPAEPPQQQQPVLPLPLSPLELDQMATKQEYTSGLQAVADFLASFTPPSETSSLTSLPERHARQPTSRGSAKVPISRGARSAL